MAEQSLPRQSDEAYIEAYEAGALAALDYVAEQRPDIEDETMVAAEKVGAYLAQVRETGLR
jgi:hypothetical protein